MSELEPSPAIHRGRCLCGRVRFEVRGALQPFAYCHCASCRRASGSAFAANAPVRRSDVVFQHGEEGITEYESSPGKHRAFCSRCGSPIYAREAQHPDWLSIRLGLFDHDPGVRARAHFNVAERAPWHPITDALPQHAGDTAESRAGSAPPAVLRGNLADDVPAELPEELTTVLCHLRGTRVERIVSRGHRSPPGFWYDQDQDELVLLASGAARLELERDGELSLRPGDWVHIPAHVRHRVSWTDPALDTLWLAVFL